jgi:ParB-like chromosome segregation protein Spo0J
LEQFKCSYDEVVDIHKLQPNPKNPNHHPEKQIKLLSKIIDYQGQRSPIVVSKRSGFIVKGHGRLEAIKQLGWNTAAVDFQDYESEAQEYADLIADNKIAELAQHDDNLMIEEIKALEIEDFELLGMDEFSIDKVASEIKNNSTELDLDSFDNFEHQCPKCGFEWNNDGSDNS